MTQRSPPSSSLSESPCRARCLIIPSLSRQSRKSIASCRHLGFALVVRLVSHFAAFVGCYLPGWLYDTSELVRNYNILCIHHLGKMPSAFACGPLAPLPRALGVHNCIDGYECQNENGLIAVWRRWVPRYPMQPHPSCAARPLSRRLPSQAASHTWIQPVRTTAFPYRPS